MRKLSSYIGRYWYGYVFAVASMVTAIALDMLYPKITQKIVDDVILGGQMEILTKLLTGIVLVGIGRSIFGYCKEFTFDFLSSKIGAEMRKDLFNHIQTLSMRYFDDTNTGELMARVKDDVDKIQNALGYVGMLLIEVTTRALLRIGFKDFTVNINDRRILRAMLEKMGFAADQLDSVCISFDKLDKVGADGVKKELLEKEFDAAAVEALDEFLRAGDFSLDAVTARVGDETLTADLRYVIATAEKIANGRYGIAYAPSLVRGQGYYTGMVFEVTCPQFSGAVAGGGRYDNMVGKFIGQQVPAVGFSIGFERVCGILLEQDYQIPGAKQKLALLYLKDADFAAVLAKADALRAAYDVTVLPQAKKLGKQFGTLEAAGYNAVAFADNDDIKVLGQKAE